MPQVGSIRGHSKDFSYIGICGVELTFSGGKIYQVPSVSFNMWKEQVYIKERILTGRDEKWRDK